MIPLNIQINTLLFSFLFGIFFSIFLNINYKFIYNNKKIYRIITSFIFVMINVIIYFIILEKINNGILHIYSIFMIIIGSIFENIVRKYIISIFVKYIKKWYNYLE